MNRIDRYIVRHIFALSAIVALALLTIYSFTTFVGDLDEAGRGGFGLPQLALYTLLNLPSGLQVLLPIIAMLGTLMGLGQLAAQNELTALRSAGVSNLRIGAAAMMAGLVLGLAGWLVGDWLAPQGRQAAERLRSESRYGGDAGVLGKPIWLREGPHVIRVGRLVSEDHLQNATIYTLGEGLRLQSVATVEDARFAGDHWLLDGYTQTLFGEQGVDITRKAQTQWRGGLSPQLLRLFVLEARSLSATGLMRLIVYLDVNGLDSASQRLDLWKKLVAPLTVMAMMLFAVPFVFGSLRSSGAGQRLLVGVVAGIAFYVVNEVSASLGLLNGWHPALAAGAPTVLLALLGLVRLQRAR